MDCHPHSVFRISDPLNRMPSVDTPVLSFVVIGLNEAARLRQSLEAAISNSPRSIAIEVIYVDSGSRDNSVGIAQGVAGVVVQHLNSQSPSAAKARNKGLRLAKGKYVQLVDGDSVIQPGWIAAALELLEQSPEVACVFGQCVEMFPEHSIYMKVCGLDWHIPAGDHRFCGGNAMWRMSAIATEGFFDETLRLGEEPDLCYRVRQRGGRIVCLSKPMVMHDLDIVHFRQYWKRGENSGVAYLRVAARYWRNPEKLWLRETIRNFLEPLAWIAVLVAGWLLGMLPLAIVLLLAWWLVRVLRVARGARARTANWADALIYGVHIQFMRIPIALGQSKALIELLRTRNEPRRA